MATIEVEAAPAGAGWQCTVTVREGASETRHAVTLDRATYERLTGGQASPEALVRESFVFLLAHEPKESILRSFDLPIIGRYFLRYEAEIRRRLGLE